MGLLSYLKNRRDELAYRIEHGMKVGKNCHFFSIETIEGRWPWLLSFGDNVTVAGSVIMTAHDASTNIVGCGTKLGRIDVGNNVFIGTGSIILCNVKIGNNVIIAAGSVVTKNIPDNGVYAGNPAKRICSIEEFRIKQEKQKAERPDFSLIHRWDEWINASAEEKQRMSDLLEDGCGYV